MSETQTGSYQTRVEAAKAETRKNLASAIWTGLRIGAGVVTLKFLWGRFLEHGGSQEELMIHQPKNSDQPPESQS